LFGVGIAVAILREIEAFPREECIFAENQAKHPNHFGSLHIGNAVDQFLGVVEPFTDDAPRIAPNPRSPVAPEAGFLMLSTWLSLTKTGLKISAMNWRSTSTV